MSPEEKPKSDLEPDLSANSDADAPGTAPIPAADSKTEPVEASLADEAVAPSGTADPEIVASEIVEVETEPTQVVYPDDPQSGTIGVFNASMYAPPALASNFENLAAKGGAVGALVLGIWCLAGSFITNWSIINGLLGLSMGFWGLTSRHKKMAWIGIVLCLAGIMLSLVQVSEFINIYMNARDENSFN